MMVPIAVGVFLVASGAICCSIFVLMIPGVLMLAWAEAVGEEAKWAITASLVLAIIVEIPAAIFTIMVIADTHSRRDLSGAFLVLLFGCAVFVIINAMFIFYLTLSSQAR